MKTKIFNNKAANFRIRMRIAERKYRQHIVIKDYRTRFAAAEKELNYEAGRIQDYPFYIVAMDIATKHQVSVIELYPATTIHSNVKPSSN